LHLAPPLLLLLLQLRLGALLHLRHFRGMFLRAPLLSRDVASKDPVDLALDGVRCGAEGSALGAEGGVLCAGLAKQTRSATLLAASSCERLEENKSLSCGTRAPSFNLF
jgi:hypothetical protein